jgi:hypothetical protein
LSFAIKSPIEDIEAREWPDLDALTKEVFDDSSSGDIHTGYISSNHENQTIKGVLYHSKCFINSEEVEINHDEKSIKEDDRFSINPFIFIRVAKPMKKDAHLPSINLEKFYPQDSRRGVDLVITPNLDLQKNHKLIELTQEAWEDVCKDEEKFETKKYKKDLMKVVDEKL